MFNKNLLKAELIMENVNLANLAKKLEINKGTLSKRMSGKSEWTLAEIKKIKDLVGIEKVTQIFLL